MLPESSEHHAYTSWCFLSSSGGTCFLSSFPLSAMPVEIDLCDCVPSFKGSIKTGLVQKMTIQLDSILGCIHGYFIGSLSLAY